MLTRASPADWINMEVIVLPLVFASDVQNGKSGSIFANLCQISRTSVFFIIFSCLHEWWQVMEPSKVIPKPC